MFINRRMGEIDVVHIYNGELMQEMGDVSPIPGSGRSLGGENATHSSILAWTFHGQRSLVGYRPWGHKQPNMTEHAHTHTLLRQHWNEIVPLAEMWMDLEIFIQSEVSQKEKNEYCIILLYVEPRKMV